MIDSLIAEVGWRNGNTSMTKLICYAAGECNLNDYGLQTT